MAEKQRREEPQKEEQEKDNDDDDDDDNDDEVEEEGAQTPRASTSGVRSTIYLTNVLFPLPLPAKL